MMKNKTDEINDFLSKIEKEVLQDFEIVDFWEADTTAIGLKINEKLVYVSTFNYDEKLNYMMTVEEFNTGKIIYKEQSLSYYELIEFIGSL